MAYTTPQALLAAINDGIQAYAEGKPYDYTVLDASFKKPTLADLRALKKEVVAEIAAANPNQNVFALAHFNRAGR